MESYTIRKKDGKLQGPYSLRVIRAFVIAGKLDASDQLITSKGDIPLIQHDELRVLWQKATGERPKVKASKAAPPEKKQPKGRVVLLQGKILPPGPNPHFAGSIKKHPLLHLMYRFALSKLTGRLHLRSNRETVDIFFEYGRPTYAMSNREETKLGLYLLHHKQLTPLQHKHAVQRAQTERRPLGQILLQEGYLSPSQIQHALIEQFKMRFFKAFEWRENAVYRFYKDQIAGAQFPIDIPSWTLLQESAFHAMPLAHIEDQLLPYRNRLVIRQIHPKLSFDDFNLTHTERTFLEDITQNDPVHDVVGAVVEAEEMTEEQAHRLLYLAWQLQFVRMGEEKIGERTARQLRELEAYIKKLKVQSRLQRLGLTGGASRSEIRQSYLQLAKKYHPDHLPPGTHPDVAKQMSEAFALIAEAYRVLIG